MAPRTTVTADPAALSDADRAALLDELDAPSASEAAVLSRELSPREKAVALLIRDRDHLDGCPGSTAAVAGWLEADDVPVYAPAAGLRKAGVRPGDVVTVVRCRGCGGSRHLVGTVRDNLRRIAGGAESAGELDQTL